MKLILKGGGGKRKKQINAILEIFIWKELKGKESGSGHYNYSVFLIHRTTTSQVWE